jgi:hypothetical protein
MVSRKFRKFGIFLKVRKGSVGEERREERRIPLLFPTSLKI